MTAVTQEAKVPLMGPVSFSNDAVTASRVDFGLDDP